MANWGRAIAVVLLLGGCSFDRTVSSDAIISCQSDAECPAESRCESASGVCVSRISSVLLTAHSVVPEVARAGATVRISVTVDRPLASPPRVTIVPRAAQPFVSFELPAQTGNVFAANWVVPEGAVEGTHSVLVELLNTSSVASRNQFVGSLTIDSTPPSVAPGSALLLAPPPESPLLTVSALALTGVATFSFASSEPLASPPTVRCARSSLTTVAFARATTSEAPWVFTGSPTSSAVEQGLCTLEVHLVDLAGNSSDTTLPGIVVDTVAPGAPDVITGGRVVLTRDPYQTSPRLELEGLEGAVEPGAVIRVSATPGAVDELARVASTDGGAFSVAALGARDWPQVYLSAVDAAANASAWVAVRDGVFVVTTSTSDPTLPQASPVELFERGAASGALSRADGVRRAGAQLAARPFRGGSSWANFGGSGAPNRYGARCVTDWAHGSIIGSSTVPFLSRWAGDHWALASGLDSESDGDPSLHEYGAVAYDRRRGHTVLYGGRGRGSNTGADDTWRFSQGSWARVLVRGEVPPSRMSHGMAWEPKTDRIVVAGGTWAGQPRGDTWALSGETWAALDAGFPPTSQTSMTVAGDDRLVVWAQVDGGASLLTLLNDAWVTLGPAPNVGDPVLAWHPVREELWLGGQQSGHAKVWAQRDGGWVEVVRPSPPSYDEPDSLCFEPSTQKMVFGTAEPLTMGANYALFIEADGGFAPLWSQRNTDRMPEGRVFHGMAWSPALQQVVIHGGIGVDALGLGDTWGWNGERATALAALPVSPPPAWDPAFTTQLFTASDGGLGLHRCFMPHVLADGGVAGAPAADVWRFGANGQWSQLGALGQPCNVHAAGAVDETGRLILAGGSRRAFSVSPRDLDTRVWALGADGTSVALPPLPTARSAAFAAPLQGFQLFGGVIAQGSSTSAATTGHLTFRANAWSMPMSPHEPDSREGAVFGADPFRGEVLLFGGTDALDEGDGVWLATRGLADAWRWSATAGWEVLEVSDPEGDGSLQSIADAKCAYDPLRRRMVVFGGKSGSAATKLDKVRQNGFDGVEELRTAEHRPEAVVQYPQPAGLGSPEARLQRVEVRGRGGASGRGAGDQPLDGFEVQVWTALGWRTIGTWAAPAASPSDFVVSLDRVPSLFSDLETGTVRVMPLGVNGSARAELRLERIEVRFGYRRE